MPSFRQVLAGIDEAWRDRRDEIERAGDAITDDAPRGGGDGAGSDEPLGEEVTAGAIAALLTAADPMWGGFGARRSSPSR